MNLQNCSIPLLVFLTSFGLFLTGLCPGIYWGDDGLLIAASVTLGLSHPPGHPTYMMANLPAMFIPAGDIAFRFNLMASLWMSLALSLITAWFTRIYPKFLTIWPGLLGLLLFSISHIFTWHQTGRAETYSLHVCLLIVCVISVCSQRKGKGLILSAFFAALMLGNQLFLAALAGPGLLFGWLVAWSKATSRLQIAIRSVLVFLLGLSIYLVPIIRSSKLPAVMWTIPGNSFDKLEFITARTYQKSFFTVGSSENDFGDRFLLVIRALTKTSGWLMPIVFICSITLGCAHFRRIRVDWLVILFVMMGTMIGTAACSGFDVENWDFQGYLLPVIVLMPVIPAMNLETLNRSGAIVRLLIALVYLSSGLIPVTVSSVGGVRSLRGRTEPALTGWAHLDSAGPEGFCLTRSDVGYVMIYLNEIEKYRSDVDLVSRGFLQRNMGRIELAGRYPGLNWPVIKSAIDYAEFTRELILENSGKSLCWELADDDAVISGLPSQAVGSMIELLPAPVIFGGARVQFNRLIGAIDENRTPGIFTDRQAVEQLSVLFYNRGTFLLNREQILEALPSFERAVRLDPKQARIYNNYGVTLAQLNRRGEAIQAFRQVLLLDPRHPGAAANIVALTRLENP